MGLLYKENQKGRSFRMLDSKVQIPFSPPDITEKEINEVIDTLKSGWITTGPKTKQFEEKLAEFTNTNKFVCLNSATAALELTLRVLGIGEGDEVITSAYTYTASASVIHHVGAKIVLVDTAENSYEMDYNQLEAVITEKTKAIIPVDIAGVMCDYDRIFDIVERKKHLFSPKNELQEAIGRIVVVADGAHSLGATYKGRKSGEVADFTAFSFHAVKNLTTAEGGAVTWRNIPGIENERIYKQYKHLALHGQTKDALSKTKLGGWEYDIVTLGYKMNMTDIMASIGLAQLKRYDSLLKKRRKIIQYYNEGLSDLNVDILQHFTNEYESSGHLYLVRLIGKDESFRDSVIDELADRGIATNVHYKPLPMLTAYKRLGFNIQDFPNAYQMYANEITLPLHTLLERDQLDYIIETFKNIVSK